VLTARGQDECRQFGDCQLGRPTDVDDAVDRGVTAARATSAAAASAAIGWISASGTRTSPSPVMVAVIISVNSWNWVARAMA
jgi:hypothetical protein